VWFCVTNQLIKAVITEDLNSFETICIAAGSYVANFVNIDFNLLIKSDLFYVVVNTMDNLNSNSDLDKEEFHEIVNNEAKIITYRRALEHI